ncbi:hypothetical protein [Lysinibacillus sp. G01H]|uniref:hypothetical protein n=1 Tax=Lysinibacillus sp. G01H TaxID=3026425 RepID=UPI00237E4619|nr:hypothetical protein [Lysinibacillus sp. G01H]WDU78851.1 hypothetical protein PSR12_19735 [Lysinibacillus sp. G01H]
MMYEFKVGWCPFCDQGWVEIVKNQMTEELLLCCNECDTNWNNYDEFKKDDIPSYFRQYEEVEFEKDYESDDDDFRFNIIKPTYQEIINKGWEKYIFKD